jgi:opacity protein-like surface antigen
MAKKCLTILVIAALSAGGIFAQEQEQGNETPKKDFGLSAGAGGFIGGDFGGGVKVDSSSLETPYFGGGVYAFFDATYAELSLGFFGGGGKMKPAEIDWSIMSLNIGLLGKYPVSIDSKLLVFPLLGIDYQIVTSSKDKDGNDLKFGEDSGPGDFSALWFKLGGGLDFAVAEKLYLRFEALYGIRLANKFENDYVKDYKDMGSDDVTTRLGHGLTAKLAVGYRF